MLLVDVMERDEALLSIEALDPPASHNMINVYVLCKTQQVLTTISGPHQTSRIVAIFNGESSKLDITTCFYVKNKT